MTATGTYYSDLVNLYGTTAYYYRAKVIGYGTTYGTEKSFTTPTAPSVTTNAATNITTNSATLGGRLTSLGTASSCGVTFQWGTAPGSYTGETAVQNMSIPDFFTADMTGLTPGLTYYFRAKAVGTGTSTGTEASFTTGTAPPGVATSTASNITTTRATLVGNLATLGTATSCNVTFQWGTSPGAYPAETPVQARSSTGTFSDNITNLTPGLTYYYRAKAVGQGTVTGSEISFTTANIPPNVFTGVASNVATTQATLGGNLTSLGTATSCNVTFQWGTAPGSYTSETPVQVKSSTGIYSATLTGLTPGLIYYFRAKAVGHGTATGSEAIFTTGTMPPAVSTAGASNVMNTQATLGGNLTSLGTATSCNVTFQWGTTPGSYTGETPIRARSSTGTFTDNITGLTPGLTYYFRAKAAGHGTATGAVSSLTTGTTPPAVTTGSATDVTVSSATLGGNLTSLGTASNCDVTFQWGTTPGSYTSETDVQARGSTGTFTDSIAGLNAGVTYYYCAKAVGHGIALGQEQSFTTGATAPTVITNPATSIMETTATLNGNLTSLGMADNATVFFEYGLSPTYGTTTSGQVRTSTGVFSDGVTGLLPGNLYHFRTVAAGGIHGTAYGQDRTFMASNPCSVEVNSGNTIGIVSGGQKTAIPLLIKNIPSLGADNGLAAFTFTLNWNNALLRVDNITATSIPNFYIVAGALNPSSSSVTIAGYATGNSYLSSDVTVADISITALGATGAIGTIGVAVSALGDKNSTPISYNTASAPVQIVSMIAETTLAQLRDTDSVSVLQVVINRIKDPSTGTTTTIPGGVGSYLAIASSSPAGGMEILSVRGAAPYNSPAFTPATGIFGVASVSAPAQPGNSTVAKLVPRLNGDCITPYTVNVAFRAISAASGGENVPEEDSNSLTVLRGDANKNGTVDIFDAMFIAQCIVGSRSWSDISIANAASIKQDGSGGDQVDVFDAMFISQYVVGNRNTKFEPVP